MGSLKSAATAGRRLGMQTSRSLPGRPGGRSSGLPPGPHLATAGAMTNDQQPQRQPSPQRTCNCSSGGADASAAGIIGAALEHKVGLRPWPRLRADLMAAVLLRVCVVALGLPCRWRSLARAARALVLTCVCVYEPRAGAHCWPGSPAPASLAVHCHAPTSAQSTNDPGSTGEAGVALRKCHLQPARRSLQPNGSRRMAALPRGSHIHTQKRNLTF